MRIFVSAILLIICFCSAIAYDDLPLTETQRFEGRILTPVEGLWLWNSGALVAIEANANGGVTLTLVDSPDPLLDTPQIIGTGTYGGSPGTYNMQLKTKGDANSKLVGKKEAKFIAKISDGNRLKLSPYSNSLKINLWRLVPYLFRYSVHRERQPDDIDGAIRVFPLLGSPEFPVVL